MDTKKLKVLKEIYGTYQDGVLIADENWNVIWSNQETKIKNITDVLDISVDDWKTDKITNPEDGTQYTFHHWKEDGIHLVICQDDPLKLILPVVKVLSSAAHTQANICRIIYRLLEELPEGDDLTLMGSLSGNCYRMHRLAHVLKGIYEQESNITEDVCFSLTAQMEDIFQNLNRMYHNYIFAVCDFETKNLFVKMDRNALVSAVLAGISVSMLEPDKFQRIEMILEETEDKTALIEISVEPEMENEQPDRRLQIKDLDAISNDKEYLNVFCKNYHCKWKTETLENRVVFSLEIPLCEQEKNLAMHLNSLTDDRYFNAYTAMLSILHHRLIM